MLLAYHVKAHNKSYDIILQALKTSLARSMLNLFANGIRLKSPANF